MHDEVEVEVESEFLIWILNSEFDFDVDDNDNDDYKLCQIWFEMLLTIEMFWYFIFFGIKNFWVYKKLFRIRKKVRNKKQETRLIISGIKTLIYLNCMLLRDEGVPSNLIKYLRKEERKRRDN